MPATLSLTETQTIAALRSVLIGFLPAGIEVVRGEVNRVAEPVGPDFCVLTPTTRVRLATNIDTFADAPTATPPVGLRSSLTAMEVTIQIDVHGPASADNAQEIATLLRDEYATIAFTRTGYDVQPLYAEDPRQTPFVNAEQQYEWRWTVDVVLQANPVIGTPQDFADVVKITPIDVESTTPEPPDLAIYDDGESRWDDGSVYQ
jgi:hypothetical protein